MAAKLRQTNFCICIFTISSNMVNYYMMVKMFVSFTNRFMAQSHRTLFLGLTTLATLLCFYFEKTTQAGSIRLLLVKVNMIISQQYLSIGVVQYSLYII